MNRNLLSIVMAIIVLAAALLACNTPATATPAPAVETQHINVAGAHPKTLSHLITEGQTILDTCPDWISQDGVNITFAPDLDVAEGDYNCDIADGTVKIVVSVRQVEPIPHFTLAQTATVTAGQQSYVYADQSVIGPGNTSYKWSGLPDWLACEGVTCHDGFLLANPPLDAVGQTFTIVAEVEDYVWLSWTGTITITVTVVQ